MVLSSITELDRINLLKAVTSISEIKIFLNQEIEIEIEMHQRRGEIGIYAAHIPANYEPRAH